MLQIRCYCFIECSRNRRAVSRHTREECFRHVGACAGGASCMCATPIGASSHVRPIYSRITGRSASVVTVELIGSSQPGWRETRGVRLRAMKSPSGNAAVASAPPSLQPSLQRGSGRMRLDNTKPSSTNHTSNGAPGRRDSQTLQLLRGVRLQVHTCCRLAQGFEGKAAPAGFTLPHARTTSCR